MKTGLIILGVVGTLIAVVVMSLIGVYNYGNSIENKLDAVWNDNQVVLSNYHKKVSEAVQVPAMYRDDLTKVVNAAIQGRYGEGGSKAVFQWLHEQNPTIDSSMYTKIQQIVEAGRDRFENNQKELVDITRQYKTALGSFPKGFMMKMMGYPRVDLEKYKVITDSSTESAFATGNEEAMTLRPKE